MKTYILCRQELFLQIKIKATFGVIIYSQV